MLGRSHSFADFPRAKSGLGIDCLLDPSNLQQRSPQLREPVELEGSKLDVHPERWFLVVGLPPLSICVDSVGCTI